MNIKAIIIDDEPLAHKVIINYLKDLDFIQIEKSFYSAIEAISFLRKESVDLIFLDIEMPQLKGFDFLKVIQQKTQIVITSAYQEYAMEGFEYGVCDYLLKPFSFERLMKAINRAQELIQGNSLNNVVISQQTEEPLSNQSIFVKSDKKMVKVKYEDIVYLEGHGAYIKFHLIDKMLLVLGRLSEYEKSLPEQLFIRVHKSFLVAKDAISEISGNQITIGDKQIPIGQIYKNSLLKVLGI